MITVKNSGSLKKMYFNTVYLGYAYKEVDGYYVFMFENGKSGAWSDYSLKAIADELTKLNKEWNDHINVNLKP